MNPTRAIPVLAVLLGGCWPRIPGQWSDYDVPKETQLLGSVDFYVPLGTYWSDTTPSGSIVLGWLDTPLVGVTAYNLPVGCINADALPPGNPNLAFADIGVSSATVRSSTGGSIALPFSASSSIFAANVTASDVPPGSAWVLDQVAGSDGAFSVNNLFTMPPDVTFAGAAWGDATPASIPRADLHVTWPDTDGVDTIVIQANVEDGSGNSLGQAICGLDPRDGEATIPLSGVGVNAGSANDVVLLMGAATETDSKLVGVYGASRFGATTYQAAYLLLE